MRSVLLLLSDDRVVFAHEGQEATNLCPLLDAQPCGWLDDPFEAGIPRGAGLGKRLARRLSYHAQNASWFQAP